MNSEEWKVDKYGHRYREVGKGMIEYEETVTVAGCVEIPISQLADFNRRQKEAAEERRRKALEELANRPKYESCPFAHGTNRKCEREKCQLFYNGRCSIATIADGTGTTLDELEKDNGEKCPFNPYKGCNTCALYNNGCAFVRLAAATNKIEK